MLRTRAYLKHKYLSYIDGQEGFQKEGKDSAESVVFIADMILNTDQQTAQEIYDELLILGMIEVKHEKNKNVVYLTKPAGLNRLQSGYFLKEHWRIVKREVKDYGVVFTTAILSIVTIWQLATDKSKDYVKQLKNISNSLKSIDTTKQKEKFLVIHDTVYLTDSLKK